MRRVVSKPHLDTITGRMQLLDSSVDSLRANVLPKHADQFGGIKVVADQSRRLEAVQELGPAASPSVKSGARLQGRTAALGQVGKTESRNLFEPDREPGSRTLSHADGWNP
jgi:hypothetical protein